MRAKSTAQHGYIAYAVSGTNTISFCIDFRAADTTGLLGFTMERILTATGEKKIADGYKVFEELISNPTPVIQVSTFDHPIQSFVWDDFTCRPGTEYQFLLYPLRGTPTDIDRTLTPISITIKTEELFTNGEHDIFFNRGVASSQAYARKFHNLAPAKIIDPVLKQKSLDWLSRDLDNAIIKFIKSAKSGETLLGCFYEFRYKAVADEFKRAIGRGVNVRLIIDAKNNETTDSDGTVHESFPKEDNLRTLDNAEISVDPEDGYVILRTANKANIQHNKFIVLLNNDADSSAREVWTGSTNISNGGIHGQTNVGHWVKNSEVAKKFKLYWELLSTNPGALENEDKAIGTKKNAAFKRAVQKLQDTIVFESWDDIPSGITAIFSPRSGEKMLNSYARMFDTAKSFACITLAFGINQLFKKYIMDNTTSSHLAFMLLEKKDKEKKDSKNPFVYVGAKQNVYKAWGSYLEEPLYNWAREVSTRSLKLNEHVAYIHSKFMLVDPLGNDPVVITGSANFSGPSTTANDENMLIIRGDRRTADIYYTEFNRIFNHYYFRAVKKNAEENNRADHAQRFLKPDDTWLEKYTDGKFRFKKIVALASMALD